MLKGLIFDLDGTIADTATYHVQAWNEMAKKHQIYLSSAQQNSLRGLSRKKALALILKDSGCQDRFSKEQQKLMINEKNQLFVALVKKMTPADILPGMRDLIKNASKANLKIALASNSKNGLLILKYLGIREYFDAIVNPANLHRSKPSPEIYQKAQELLGLACDEVVSFDDSINGVKAIKAASQLAIGIGKKEWSVKPDYVVSATNKLSLDLVNKIYQEHSI